MEEEKIVLTLNSEKKQETTPIQQDDVKEMNLKDIDTSMLSLEDMKTVDDFAKQIDLTDGQAIMSYGANSQNKIADFSDNALKDVKTKDLGEIGNMITDLVVELKGFDIEEEKGFLGLFKKTANKFEALKAKYGKAEVNVEKISKLLEDQQIQLLKDIALLDELYAKNEVNKKELTMYILAGHKKLEVAQNEELPKLYAIAKESGLTEDAQKANDYANLINRFEKKLYDLELTRMIAVQMSPQIRLLQNNDTLMAEKIQSTLINTIPLWKSQMLIALGLSHSEQAIKTEQEVNEFTNSLLKKNAEALKQGTIKTAEASEKGIVELETLQMTNQSLIDTLDEVLRIQTEGKAKRIEAEKELVRLEGQLKEKLLAVKDNIK